jgi:hypothetical protein
LNLREVEMPVRVSKLGKALVLGLFLVVDLGAGLDTPPMPELPFLDANTPLPKAHKFPEAFFP